VRRDRKTVLADAAIEVLGGDGLRALTHRAVEHRAGLPAGTCGYHYKTRPALLAAVLLRIADLDRYDAERAFAALASTGSGGPAQLVALVDRLGAVEVLATVLERGPLAAPERTRARLVLMIDPEARRELGAALAETAAGFVALAGALLVALLDGLVVDAVIRGQPADPHRLRDAVRAVWQAVTA
jgi:DNA-binding transcriptional regulator YbjK